MVIELEVKRFLDLEALDYGITLVSFRLWARVQFQHRFGWTPTMPALIDTGAPFSVLPKTLWPDLDTTGGFPTALRGLIPHRTAVLKAQLAQVTCKLLDQRTSTSPLTLWALLADGNVPVVLGCAGLLDRAKLLVEAAREHASLELSA